MENRVQRGNNNYLSSGRPTRHPVVFLQYLSFFVLLLVNVSIRVTMQITRESRHIHTGEHILGLQAHRLSTLTSFCSDR